MSFCPTCLDDIMCEIDNEEYYSDYKWVDTTRHLRREEVPVVW